MTQVKNLDLLAAALLAQSDAVMQRWRERVRVLASARGLDLPTLNDHMPVWIADLAAALQAISRAGHDQGEGESSPPAHGLQRDRKSTRLNSSHTMTSRMPSSA